MDFETFVAILGGVLGGYGAFKHDVRIVGAGVVVLAVALILAWQVAG